MKKTLKRALALSCAAIMLVTCMTGCGKKEGDSSGSGQQQSQTEKKGRKLAMICGSAEMPFTQVLVAGAESAVRDGDELAIYYCDWDAAKEVQLMEDICANGVDMLMIDPADPMPCCLLCRLRRTRKPLLSPMTAAQTILSS